MRETVNHIERFETFVGLQVADIITTLIFLQIGVLEANPFVRFFMDSTHPVIGLILVKILAVLIALAYIRKGNTLRRVNFFFLGLVVWNVGSITAALAGIGV